MLNFYDMQLVNGIVVPKPDFMINEHSWLNYDDYSHRCITRIIRSLTLLGQEELGLAFQKGMIEVALQHGNVKEESLNYWRNAHII